MKVSNVFRLEKLMQPMRTPFRFFALSTLSLVCWSLPNTDAYAESVKGRVTLSESLENGRRFPGYWRVENGSVPVSPAVTPDPPVVLVTDAKGQAPEAKTFAVDIAGFGANKPTLIVGTNSVVEIRNGDKVPHDLSIPGQEALMPLERLAPGTLRRQKFPVPGVYEIRSAQYPHLSIAVIVVDNPYAAICDAKGNFKLPDMPEGKATLKVWARGQFVHEQAIDVRNNMKALQIDVASASPVDPE
ncbi:MAG: hypothetical protein SF187_06485 [Deltaproteobacteria bacterium]|nr:hypothetical protein [Deltaproteobacteria bacterium]